MSTKSTIGYVKLPELVWIARHGTHYHKKDCPQVMNNPEYFAIERPNIRRYKTIGNDPYEPCPSCLTEEYKTWVDPVVAKLIKKGKGK